MELKKKRGITMSFLAFIIFALVIGTLLIWGLIHEDKLIGIEDKVILIIRRKLHRIFQPKVTVEKVSVSNGTNKSYKVNETYFDYIAGKFKTKPDNYIL